MTLSEASRGRLRVFLGAGPGVGKTHATLAEAERLAVAGADVVVGVVETHDRVGTAAASERLEVLPRRQISYRGTTFGELDLDGVFVRNPDVIVIDELAHTNVPGSRNDKRWQDVEEILDGGIDVLTNLNVQHLDGLNTEAERIIGFQQRETVPDAVVQAAEQIDFVDDARTEGGFPADTIAALRSMAERWLAGRGQIDLDRGGSVVVALTGAPEGERVVRRAAEIADASRGPLLGVHVRSPSGLVEAEPAWLERQRRLLIERGGRFTEVAGEHVADTVVEFARHEGAAHLVLGATRRSRRYEFFHGSVIGRALRHAAEIEVHVVPWHGEARALRRPASEWSGFRPRLSVPGRRRLVAWLLAVVAPFALSLLLLPFRSSLGVAGDLFCVMLAVVAVAAIGGIAPALLAVALGVLLGDYYFTVPYHTLRVDRLVDIVALVAFAIVGVVVGVLVDVLARQSVRVAGSQAESEGLARLVAEALLSYPSDVVGIAGAVRRTFDLDSVAVLRRNGTEWTVDAADGSPVPAAPNDAFVSAVLSDGRILALTGAKLAEAEGVLVRAFVTQLHLQREHTQLSALPRR